MRPRPAIAGLWLLLAAVSSPGALSAQRPEAVRVALYEEEVSLDLSGDAVVTTRIELAGEAPARWWLPFGHEVAEDLAVEPREGVAVAAVEVAGSGALELRTAASRGSLRSLTVRFTLPRLYDWSAPPEAFGNRRVAHQLVHTQPLEIDRYRLRMILPAGFRVNEVLRTTPPFNPKKASELPFELGEEHGRATVALVVDGLVLGDRVGLELEVKSARRSATLWIAGLLVSVLYLLFFRDVLRPSGEGEPS